MSRKIERLLVANRGEIAIRIVRAAQDLQIRTIAIFSEEDHGGRHRFSADESYLVGSGRSPVDAYLDVDDVIRVARPAVLFGEDRDRAHLEILRRAHDADGDLAAVGDEEAFDLAAHDGILALRQ